VQIRVSSVDRSGTSSAGHISVCDRSEADAFEPDVLFYCSKESSVRGYSDVDHRWIILGLISGFIASKVVNRTGEGFFLDIVLGLSGLS